MFQSLTIKTAMAAIFIFTSTTAGAETMDNNWDKVFAQSEQVSVSKVTFKNRYGITLAGDLYTPKNKTAEKTLPKNGFIGHFL